MITEGIHTDISITDYHADRDYLSATSIKEAKISLRQFDWHRRGLMPPSDGKHLDYGNAFELALLDPEGFKREVAIAQTEYWIAKAMESNPDYKVPKNSGIYKGHRDKFIQDNESKLYQIDDVGPQSYEYIEKMLESCKMDAVISKLIEGTEYQLSLFWTDEESGLKLKTRPDICKRKKNSVVNLKTTLDGSPKAFVRDMIKYNYPLQACMEIKGSLATGLMDTVDNYFWLVVEKVPPFNATIYSFTESDIASTMNELKYYLNKIAQAQEKRFYPGYSDTSMNEYGIIPIVLPPYYS